MARERVVRCVGLGFKDVASELLTVSFIGDCTFVNAGGGGAAGSTCSAATCAATEQTLASPSSAARDSFSFMTLLYC
jgi:hypothetical protein